MIELDRETALAQPAAAAFAKPDGGPEQVLHQVGNIHSYPLGQLIDATLFAAALDQAPAMYIARPDGSLIYANPGYRHISQSRQFTGDGDDSPLKLADAHRKLVIETAKTRKPQYLRLNLPLNGEGRDFLCRHSPIFDDAGKIVAISGTFIDATKENLAERRLKWERQRFIDFTRAASDWIWETDEQGMITFISENATEAFGLPPVMLKGKRLEDFGEFPDGAPGKPNGTSPRPAAKNPAGNPALIAQKARRPYRDAPFVIPASEGPARHFHLSAVPVFDLDGKFSGYRGTGHDVTARLKSEQETRDAKVQLEKTLEQLRNKNLQLEIVAEEATSAAKAKSEFLATMSHELRTPLNAILGFAEAMHLKTFGDLNERYQDYAFDIMSAGKHLMSLIEDILDIARIENNALNLKIESLPLAGLVHEVRTMSEMRASDGKVCIGTFDYDGPIKLQADKTRFIQILSNLLSNAIKFCPEEGAVGLIVNADAQNVHITVWDNGPGISPCMHEAVFENFKQAHEGIYKRGEQGIGLGLALSRKLARHMHGDITLQSEPGKGSRFTIRLPIGNQD